MIPDIVYKTLDSLTVRHPESSADFANIKIILQTMDARNVERTNTALRLGLIKQA